MHNSVNEWITANHSFNSIFNTAFSLCTAAGVSPLHKCPPGYVGVGTCLPPFENCDVGFCYIEDKFSLILGQSGVCCLRRK